MWYKYVTLFLLDKKNLPYICGKSIYYKLSAEKKIDIWSRISIIYLNNFRSPQY